MRDLDAFFTPEPLATQMVDAIEREVETVVDPAAGDGALLRCAARRWPEARVVASEIDRRRVKALARTGGWKVQAGDFLQRNTATRLTRLVGSAPSRSVLLNPPFSHRGPTRFSLPIDAMSGIDGSRAMAFFLGSSRLVGENGQLVALMPAGVMSSERDAASRRWLEKRGNLEEISRPSKRTFVGSVAETVVVRWTPLIDRESDAQECANLKRAGPAGWELIRGSRQMHTVTPASGPGTVRLIHTTNMRDGRLSGVSVRIKPTQADRVLRGPVVLIPRVGRPDPRKLVVYAGTRIALSDCVFALRHSNDAACRAMRDLLAGEFDRLRACYGGTGAPYLRRAALLDLIAEMAPATSRGS
jgi:hypothetical protein